MNRVFLETIRAVEGEVFNLPYHQNRYESVLKKFNIKNPKNLIDYIEPPKNGTYRCRLLYDISKNPHTVEVTYHEYKKRDINSLKIVYDDDIEYSLKYADRGDLDALYEQRGVCDDILIVKNSLVTDTTIANIAFYDSDRWITPKNPLLKGTTRERFIREKMIFEEDIYVEDIKRFSKVALMNAMIDFDIITKNIKDFFC